MAETYQIASIEDIRRLELTPFRERLPFDSTFEVISHGAALNPQAPALSLIADGRAYDEPLTVSYAQLLGRIRQTANLFHDLGLGHQEVVTYLLPSLPQTHFVLWGGELAGIANPVNPLLEPETIRDICNAARTKILVALGPQPGVDIWAKVAAIKDQIPTLKAVVRVMGSGEEEAGVVDYDRVIDSYPADRLTFERRIDPDDIASMYHTGGTTGRPKLARRSHYNEVVLAWDIAVCTDLQPGNAVLCGLPLFHCNGTCVTGLMPFFRGGHVILLTPAGYRDPAIMANFWKVVEHYKPTFFSAVPTVLGGLLNVPLDGADVSSLRYTICGAAPLSVELYQRFEAYSGLKIMEGYGMTETACASAVNPKDGPAKVGSIGIRFPYHWIKVVILDEAGRYLREAETDEIGVVSVKGPCVFKGYVEEVHNQGIWLDEDRTWFNTGDLGRRDADGYLWLTGRRKELIIRGGHNIDPAVIEEALYKLDGVAVAAAVGRPDAHAGEVPVAFVQLSEGAELSEETLLAWAKDNIGERAAVPKQINIIQTMPLTAIGKIFKPALVWQATREVYAHQLADLPGAEKVRVSVGEDKLHGARADITLTAAPGANKDALTQSVKDALANYTIHYKLEIV